jgi:hypothetical protein
MKILKTTLIALLTIITLGASANTESVTKNSLENMEYGYNSNIQTRSFYQGHGCHAHVVYQQRHKIWNSREVCGPYGHYTQTTYVWSMWYRV